MSDSSGSNFGGTAGIKKLGFTGGLHGLPECDQGSGILLMKLSNRIVSIKSFIIYIDTFEIWIIMNSYYRALIIATAVSIYSQIMSITLYNSTVTFHFLL